jgi:hypothetical protein
MLVCQNLLSQSLAKIIDFEASKAGSKKKNLEIIEITQIYAKQSTNLHKTNSMSANV